MHISGLGIYDPSTATNGKVRFKEIIDNINRRMLGLPTMTQRLMEVPFELDHPYWVTDGSYDPDFHIRHIALPKPGEWRQLCILVSRLHSRPLVHFVNVARNTVPGMANRMSPSLNCVITNVPGPPIPLYHTGAKLLASYGTGPVQDGFGLFIAIGSYCGDFVISATSCREMMPDPAFFRERLQDSCNELFTAAGDTI